jgi:hypothetical protein
MTDRQFLQRMKKMVKATHWIKGTLKKPIEWERDDEGKYCMMENGQYKPSKYGHCLMGLVAVVAEVDTSSFSDGWESHIKDYPQAARITKRLFDNLPDSSKRNLRRSTMDYPSVSQAFFVEEFNDSLNTSRGDIVLLLDRSIEKKVTN